MTYDSVPLRLVSRTACLLVAAALVALPPDRTSAAQGQDAISRAELEREAQRIHTSLRKQHLPHGTIFDPVFATPGSDVIVGYAHAGDSAIWTGHFIAAESFRYAVTGSNKAKRQVKKAVRAVAALVDVTGLDVLARASAPIDSPWLPAITNDGQPVYRGQIGGVDHDWLGRTSRDQYSGVMFGLSWAYELVPVNKVRNQVRDIVTRLLENLLEHDWAVWMPDGSVSTIFLQRPDQQLAFLQIGRQVNPERFTATYEDYRRRLRSLVNIPILAEITDVHGSYFKFNLDAINLSHLARLEDTHEGQVSYEHSFKTLRDAVRTHRNAHFNMLERVIEGPDATRDAETRQLLLAWLLRPRRDVWVDLRDAYVNCGENRGCGPIPVLERPSTDFLWQRSPFLLSGGGDGTIGGAGIDFVLPYWMARYYGVI